jgi:putative sterol carrier protein
MSAIFPDPDWIKELEVKLNNDTHYAQVASKWEWDLCFIIEPEGNLKEQRIFYLDLWHGKCRKADAPSDLTAYDPAFTLKAAYGNFVRVLKGDLDPMQAMLTRKLGVKGSMAIMMRNIPVVLDFVRCCREITSEVR